MSIGVHSTSRSAPSFVLEVWTQSPADTLPFDISVRMGDKAKEQAGDVEREGGDSGFRQGNLTAFIGSLSSPLPLRAF